MKRSTLLAGCFAASLMWSLYISMNVVPWRKQRSMPFDDQALDRGDGGVGRQSAAYIERQTTRYVSNKPISNNSSVNGAIVHKKVDQTDNRTHEHWKIMAEFVERKMNATYNASASQTVKEVQQPLPDTKKNRPPIDIIDPDVFFRKKPNKINDFNYDTLLNEPNICASKKELELVILVTSAVDHWERREAVRATWGKVNTTHVAVVFLIGGTSSSLQKKLKTESEQYHDMVQHSYTDTYDALPTKTIMGLRWARDFCQQATFVMKTDDDILLNVTYLLDTVRAQNTTRRLLIGAGAGGAKVQRSGKWKLTREEYPFSHFHAYLSGAAYVMSQDVVHAITDAAEYFPMIHIEDVFVTGMLARMGGFVPVGVRTFPQWATRGSRNTCLFIRGQSIGLHATSVRQYYVTWQKYINQEPCVLYKSQH